MKAHPVADLFPMLAADELAELAEDIKTRGLLQPIVLDSEGRILDGRNRYEACEAADVEPVYVTYEGDDPDGYALAVNIARRSLSTGAKAIITARAARMDGKSTREAAAETNLFQSRLNEANLILDHAPDQADAVLAGLPFSKALETARASAIASLTAAKLQPTCPGLETGDCEVLHWDDAGNVTARDTKTGEIQTLAMEWECPVIEAARRGEKE